MKLRSYVMKIELDNEVLYKIKDDVMVEFLKDDIDTVFERELEDEY